MRCFTLDSFFFFLSSYDKDALKIEQIMEIGGAGRLYVVNSTANMVEAGSGIYVGVSDSTLNVNNGDDIKLYSVPTDKYSKYTFNVTYTLLGSTEIDEKGKDYVRSFTLAGLQTEIPIVPMVTGNTEQVITSFAKFALKYMNNDC